MSNYAVMVADGGGGGSKKSDITGTKLSIADVLGGNVPFSVDILYEKKIDMETARSQISATTSALETYLSDTSTKVTDIQSMMAETNSKRFNNPEDLSKLTTANQDLEGLYNTLKNLNDEDIESIVSQYNEKLKVLKNGARFQILKDRAEEINAAAKAGTSTYYYAGEHNKSFEYPFNDYNYPYDHEDGEMAYMKYSDVTIVDKNTSTEFGALPQMYVKGKYTKYKYIKWWGIIKNGLWNGWPWNAMDDDVNKLEGRFETHGIPLPYEKGSIVDL